MMTKKTLPNAGRTSKGGLGAASDVGTIGEKPPHVFIFAQQLAADCLLLSLLEGVSQKGGNEQELHTL